MTTKQIKKANIIGEVKDIFVGVAFPLIIQLLFSSLIILFAEVEDQAIAMLACIAGELMIFFALFIFGRKSGEEAYKKTMLNQKKRELNPDDEGNALTFGEFAIYKGFVIGFISALPYVIMHIIYLIFPAKFIEFILLYACGWAVEPIKIITGNISPLSLLFVLLPVVVHGIGYLLGKNRQIKIQQVIDQKTKGKRK